MCKKYIYIISIFILVSSCGGNTLDSMKRGITGGKAKTTDEFFIEKKDPLILPPDYENLPTPGDKTAASDEISSFEESLGNTIESISAESSGNSTSTEKSILKKIQTK